MKRVNLLLSLQQVMNGPLDEVPEWMEYFCNSALFMDDFSVTVEGTEKRSSQIGAEVHKDLWNTDAEGQ